MIRALPAIGLLVVTPLLVAPAGVRSQTSESTDALAILRAAVAHTRPEFEEFAGSAARPLYLDLGYEPFDPPDPELAAPLARTIGASVARSGDVIACPEAAHGVADCTARGAVLIPSRPVINTAGATASVWIHYLFVSPKGRPASLEIRLLLQLTAGNTWRVVREIKREVT